MKKDKKGEYCPYVKLDYELLNSAVWTALDEIEQSVFIDFLKQFDFEKEFRHLVLPFSEESWRLSKQKFTNVKRNLVHYGLLDKVKDGGLNYGGKPNPDVYALSMRWKEISRKIVDKEGKEAIRLGLAPKRRSRDNTKNLPQFRKKDADSKSIV